MLLFFYAMNGKLPLGATDVGRHCVIVLSHQRCIKNTVVHYDIFIRVSSVFNHFIFIHI